MRSIPSACCCGVAGVLVLVQSLYAPASALQLAGYDAKTEPLNEANIALDAAAIKETDDLKLKKEIYKNGRFSQYEDPKTLALVNRSLSSLSTESADIMKDDDMYNVFRWAFNYIGVEKEHEDLNHFDDRDVALYAETITLDLFDLNVENIETDSAVVTGVWMTVAHYLYDAMNKCKSIPTATGDSLDGEESLDKAVAYWVGMDQEFGDNGSGHLMYSITEKAGERFGQDVNVETTVNTNIILLMNQIKTEIIETGKCQQDSGYVEFRAIVDKIIGQMTVPLVQNLIHYSAEKKEKFLELYALALVPQISACDPTAFDWFLEELVMKDLDAQDFDEVVSTLQSLYPCLGITCADVGSYKNGQVPECQDGGDGIVAMAGYTPDTDAREILKLDRDILRIDMLMEWEAIDAAAEVYYRGRNSKKDDGNNLSLQQLAKSDKRSAVPEYTWFSEYYNDPDYADTLIRNAFDKASTFAGASVDQRKEAVFRALQSMVMPMYALQEMHTAVSECADQQQASTAAWDRGAAAYIGSIEGKETGGTDKGKLLFALANEMCSLFDVCSGNEAEVNNQMVDFFTRGAESLTSGSCGSLPNPTLPSSLVGDMKIVMLQGMLHYAAVNEKLNAGAEQGSTGALHSLSRSILPYLDKSSADFASLVDINTKFDPTAKPVPDGADAVYSSVAKSLTGMQVDCAEVGVYGSIANGDLCALAGGTTPAAPTPATPTQPVPSPTAPAPVPTATPPTVTPPTAAPPTQGAPEPAGGPVGYAYSTAGQGFAMIALDVKDIGSSSVADAKTIYNSGKNAKVTVNGAESTIDIASLSLDAESRFGQDRLYNIFRFAFKDEPVFTDGGTGSLADSSYANTVIAKAFDVAEDTELAAEASVVMNIYMEIVHQLELAVSSCQDTSINGALAVDTAAAYYIGTGQTKGDESSGNLMYSLAEKSAARFGQGSGEAPVNTKIISLFKDAKLLADSCSSTPNSDPIALRFTVDQIVSQMNVPLIRNLIYYMNAADDDDNDLENFIELYALSIVPQVSGCSPGLFGYLRDELIDYEWDPDDLPDILDKMQDSLSCFGLTCADIGTLQVDSAREQLCGSGTGADTSIAGYKPSTDVSKHAVIDRDVLQIGILMQMGAFQTAKNIYLRGQNSIDPMNSGYYRTLQDLATDDDRNVVDKDGKTLNSQFMRFSTYYQDPYYADSIIMDALEKKAPFTGASNDQLKEVVVRSLQTMVTYMHSLQQLYTAIKQCRSGEEGNGLGAWDHGAATFIGSIEGAAKVDDHPKGGQLIYALGNSLCDAFGKCSDSGAGVTSEKLVEYLTGGQLFLQDKECESALDLINAGVAPALKVALVQGSLHYASEMTKGNGSTDTSLGAGHALMSATVPLIDESDATSATIIESNMEFDLSRTPIPDGIDTVFDAFMDSLVKMDVDCEDVGEHMTAPVRDICMPDVVKPSTGTSLGGQGLYVTTTYVQDRSMLALDLRDMEKALKAGNKDTAIGIYEGGLNSIIYDKNGQDIGTRSLASFSTTAPLVMSQEPTYNVFLYAFKYDGSETYLGGPVGEYADAIVQKAFTSQNDVMLPVEAARVMNLWMYVVHELYQTIENCRRKLVKDDDGIHSIDEVAAYYIGDGQVTGSSEEGHSLYALAERMGESFGQDASGQTVVNTNILRLLNDAKLEISFPGACTTNPETYKRVRTIAHKIISQMTVPLIQSLIVNLVNNDRDRVKLYAQAVVPLIAGCNPTTFEDLYGKLIASDYNVVDVDGMIESLERSYECLGITCEDVGVYKDYGADCKESPMLSPLAGFVPQTDVRKYSSLDLDIHNINIFMKEKAYDAVKDYYTLGKYASMQTSAGEEVFSLKDLATTSRRQVVPSFEYFKRYFDAEFDLDVSASYGDLDVAENYGDHIVQRALDKDALPLASADQRTEMVVKTLQYMVGYMAALGAMHGAISDCESNDSRRNDNSANEWDRAAALLIGSLEGEETGGSGKGMMMHSLANEMCKDFNRCAASGNSLLNEELVTLLYSGRGETLGGNCQALKKTSREIEALIQVPLIQGTLWYAIQNEQLLFFDQSGDLAAGYVFSRSILPYVSEADGEAARVIKTNMDFQFDSEPVPDGARAVFSAFSKAIPEMGGVDCEKVGFVDGLGVCGTSASSHQYARLSFSTFSIISVLSLFGHLLI